MRKPRVRLLFYIWGERILKGKLTVCGFSQSEPLLFALRTLLQEILLLDNLNAVIEIAFYDLCQYIK
jgi:hypothetical protein